jgi:hypothetical protein
MGHNTITQDPNNLNPNCDAVSRYAKAAIRISVRLRNKIRTLNICENCRKEFFPSCRSKNDINAESILVDDKDVPLNFNTKTMCACYNCSNEADIFLGIVRLPESGYFCASCAVDIKLHGIAEEVI